MENSNSHKYICRGKPTKLYATYYAMKSRCYNNNNHAYDRYGGRGIKICDEWLNDYESFYSWSIQNGYREGLSIDRINNNGNYSPDNCRWTTPYYQNRNRRSNHLITVNGETGLLFDIARKYGVSPKLVSKRINVYGWSDEKAVLEPKRR